MKPLRHYISLILCILTLRFITPFHALAVSPTYTGNRSSLCQTDTDTKSTDTSRKASDVSKDLYLAIGDSITKGVGLNDPADCFVSQLSSSFTKQTPDLITYNLGKQGDTIADTLSLISQPNTLPLLQQASIITLTTGGNDILALATATAKSVTSNDYSNADKIPSMVKKESTAKFLLRYLKTAQAQEELSAFVSDFAKEYQQLISFIRQENPNCTIITQSIYNPICATEYPSLAECVDLVLTPINECLREETLNAEQSKLYYLDTYRLFRENTNLYIRTSEDDIHPTKEGHTLIATEIQQMLNNAETANSNHIEAANSDVTNGSSSQYPSTQTTNAKTVSDNVIFFPYSYFFLAVLIGAIFYFFRKQKCTHKKRR